MKNRSFRNCLAHYGLGQYISEEELIPNDLLEGLTKKTFDTKYIAAKEKLYFYLSELVQQIEKAIFPISQYHVRQKRKKQKYYNREIVEILSHP